MSDGVQLGQVQASVGLNLGPLQNDVREATRTLKNFAKELEGLRFNPDNILAGVEITQQAFGNLKFNPDGILAGFREVSSGLKELTSDIGSVRTNFGGLKRSLTFGNTHLAGLKEASAGLRGVGTAAAGTEKHLSSLTALKVNFSEIVTGTGNAAAGLNNISEAATKARSHIQALTVEQARAAKIGAVGARLSTIGSGLRAGGQALTYGYSAPVAAAAGYAIKQSIAYEADFSNVRKTTGGTEAQSKALREQLEALSTEKGMPKSFKEITDIASTVGQLGVARDQVKNVTEDIIKLNVATKLSTETGAMGMVKFANSIGLPAQNIGRLGSVISELDKDSKATSNEVLSMALRIGGVGHAAGLSGPQILAFANAFAGVGVRAQQGGSAISTSIIQIDRAVNAGGKKLQEFANVAGMTTDQFKTAFKNNAAGALASFIEGLGKLRDSHVDLIPIMDALGLKSKLEIDAMLRASGAGHALSNSLGRVDKAYSDNTATTARYNNAINNTAQHLKDIQHEADLTASRLGDALLPSVKALLPDIENLLSAVNHLVAKFETLPQPVRDGALEFVAATVAAGPLIVVLGSVFTAVGSVASGVAAFKALKGGAALAEVTTGIEAAGTAQTTFAASGAKLLGTTGLWGLAIAGAIYDITQIKQLWDMAADAQSNYAKAKVGDAKVAAGYAAMAASPKERVALRGSMYQISSELEKDKPQLAAYKQKMGFQFGTPDVSQWSKHPGGRFAASEVARMQARVEALSAAFSKEQARYKQTMPAAGAAGSPASASSPYVQRALGLVGQSGAELLNKCKVFVDNGLKAGWEKHAQALAGHQANYPNGTVVHLTKGGKGTTNHWAYIYHGKLLENASNYKTGIASVINKRPVSSVMGRIDRAYMPNASDAIPLGQAGRSSLYHNVSASVAPAPGGVRFNPALFAGQTPAALAAAAQAAKRYKIAARINTQDSRIAVEAPMSAFDKKRMEAVFAYQDKTQKPGVDKGKAWAATQAQLTQIDKAEDASIAKHKKEVADHLAAIKKAFADFVAGLSSIIASALSKAAKATKAPDAMAVARDAKITADEKQHTAQLAKIAAAVKSGAATPQQGKDATVLADSVLADNKKAAWAEYNKAVLAESTKTAGEVTALQKRIAKTSLEANARVWSEADAEAIAYFQQLRSNAQKAWAQTDADIDKLKGDGTFIVADPKQRAAMHKENKNNYTKALGKIDFQETDAATKRKLDTLREGMSDAQDTYENSDGQQADKQALADSLAKLRTQIPQDGSLAADNLRNGIDKQLKGLSKDGQSTVSELGRNIAESFGNAFEGAMSHARHFRSFWKEMMAGLGTSAKQGAMGFLSREMKDGVLSLFTHKQPGVKPQGAAPQNSGLSAFASLFSGASQSGGSGSGASSGVTSTIDMIKTAVGGGVPLSAIAMGGGGGGLGAAFGAMSALQGLGALGKGGLGHDPGMSGGGGLGAVSQMAGLFGGKGGLMGGLLGHGGLAGMFAHGGLMTSGGALGGFGAALPWVGGGLLLNKLLGNPFGRMFKKMHLFSGGGIVPGHGFHDTVPAMLTPGEVVQNHEQQKQAMGHGSPIINITHHGDNHGVDDVNAMHKDWAFSVAQQLTTATPGN